MVKGCYYGKRGGVEAVFCRGTTGGRGKGQRWCSVEGLRGEGRG